MKIVALCVFYQKGTGAAGGGNSALAAAASSGNNGEADPILLHMVQDLSEYGYFERSTMRQIVTMFIRLVAKRTPAGTRQTVQHAESGNFVHCYKQSDGLGVSVLSDSEYPQRVAFNLVGTMLEAFKKKYSPTQYRAATADEVCKGFGALDKALVEWQDPANADRLTQIHGELDKVKLVMQDNIEKVR